MLNEERVKHMVKLAFYETKGGNEEIKMSLRHKKDYISFNTFWSVLWMTIAYIVLILLLGLTFMMDLIGLMTKAQLLATIISLGGIYLILFITYTVKVRNIYKRKHARAYHRVKKFKNDLAELEKMYQKEDVNE